MMAYGLSAAVNSGLFENMVSPPTMPRSGARQWYGAEFIERPAELATDTAKWIDAVTDVLRKLAQRDYHPEYLCQIFPNCPLVFRDNVIANGKLFCERTASFKFLW